MTMRVGIVGGYGKMGQWFCRNLPECDIAIYGRDVERTQQCAQHLGVTPLENLESLLAFAEMIIVSVPLVENASMLEKIRDLLPPDRKICDIASLKSASVQILSTYPHHATVSSVHPMFGPGTPGFEGKKVVIVPLESREKEAHFFYSFFKDRGASVMMSDAATHDRMMALTLSLPHFFGYLFSSMVSDHSLELMHQFEGTSFTYLLTFSEAVLQEDPHFYYELMQNPQFKTVLEDLLEQAEALRTMITTGDKSSFLQLIRKIRKALQEEDLSKAYELFSRLTE
jgi:prephenate dehydrogenase